MNGELLLYVLVWLVAAYSVATLARRAHAWRRGEPLPPPRWLPYRIHWVSLVGFTLFWTTFAVQILHWNVSLPYGPAKLIAVVLILVGSFLPPGERAAGPRSRVRAT